MELVSTSQEFLEASWASAAAAARRRSTSAGRPSSRSPTIREHTAELGIPWWTLAPFGLADGDGENEIPDGRPAAPLEELADDSRSGPFAISIEAQPAMAYRGETSRMIGDVRQWLTDGWRVVLVSEGHGPAQRLAEVLQGRGVRRAARRHRGRARGRRSLRVDRRAAPGVQLAGGEAGGADRGGLRRPGRLPAGRAGRAAAAVRAAARRGRPAAAAGGRLRGARAARGRPVRRDDQQDRGRRDPRVPGPRVRRGQARASARPAVRADRPARRGHQVRPAARRLPCTGSAARTGPRPRAGRARRSARSRPS